MSGRLYLKPGKLRYKGKMWLLIPLLGILVPILGMSGCTKFVVQPTLPCPPRPVLESISIEEQASMDPSTVFKLGENQLKLKTYAKKLEVRAGCELIVP